MRTSDHRTQPNIETLHPATADSAPSADSIERIGTSAGETIVRPRRCYVCSINKERQRTRPLLKTISFVDKHTSLTATVSYRRAER